MAIRTVKADPEIIRRVGLGAQQCVVCGWVYKDTELPTSTGECLNAECGPTTLIQHQCGWCGGLTPHYCKEVGADIAPHIARYHLTEQQGKAVQEILNRYVNEELAPRVDMESLSHLNDPNLEREVQKDIDYITGLAELFD